jgi:hypothetical protein
LGATEKTVGVVRKNGGGRRQQSRREEKGRRIEGEG